MARLRAVVVVAVVLVLGAWSCQVPTDSGQVSPGSPGATVASGVTTTGLTTLLSGEDWHYVNGAGEPAWENGWGPEGSSTGLAFRLRADGAVDLYGVISNSSATTATIFTLPAGYRPTQTVFMPIIGVTSGAVTGNAVAGNLTIGTDGQVSVGRGVAGGTGLSMALINGSFFLAPG